ncbi:MAG: NAD-dependent epimerase/dehydratase family protein [Chitinophagaceae bacterium]
MKKVLISGGSGLIGRHLTDILLQNGYAVAWLSRSVKPHKDVNMYKWDVDAGYIDPEAILWADVLVHLAGESIAGKRWTAKRKQAIIESRTKSTELLIAAMQQHNHHIEQVVAASAIGFYGETGENVC